MGVPTAIQASAERHDAPIKTAWLGVAASALEPPTG
jgi:hypothetical protein